MARDILSTIDGLDRRFGFTSEGELIVPDAGLRTASGAEVVFVESDDPIDILTPIDGPGVVFGISSDGYLIVPEAESGRSRAPSPAASSRTTARKSCPLPMATT